MKRQIPSIRYLLFKDHSFYKKLKELLGYYPRNPEIFHVAFTHKSATLKQGNGESINNERLEYLGDAILDAVIAEYLYHYYPLQKEGFLTKLRARIVSRDQLNQLAMELGLDDYIVSYVHTRDIKNIYGNALEALIGAIFIDGGYKRTKKFILKQIIDKRLDINNIENENTDFKSQIIEWAQKNKQKLTFLDEELESDNPGQSFTAQILLNNRPVGEGEGTSKKEAQQKAAKQALKKKDLLQPNHS